jgi:putative redox protein
MLITVRFPGGKQVDALADGFVIRTDQSNAHGGTGNFAEPFTYFLASLATCAGVFALGFCQARGLPTQGLELTQDAQFNPATHALERVTLHVHPPQDFPERYLAALKHTVENCSVKRVLANPPVLEVQVDAPAPAQAQRVL